MLSVIGSVPQAFAAVVAPGAGVPAPAVEPPPPGGLGDAEPWHAATASSTAAPVASFRVNLDCSIVSSSGTNRWVALVKRSARLRASSGALQAAVATGQARTPWVRRRPARPPAESERPRCRDLRAAGLERRHPCHQELAALDHMRSDGGFEKLRIAKLQGGRDRLVLGDQRRRIG